MFSLNSRFVLLLISILFLSACGGGSVDTKATGNLPDESDSNNVDTTEKNAVAMVSSNADLGNAHVLEGSAVDGNRYIHLQEGSDWSARGVRQVVFYCCKNSSSSHAQFLPDSVPPYSINVDFSQYQDGNYELYIDVYFKDQNQPVPFYINFNVSNSFPPVNTSNNLPTISGNPVRSLYENKVYNFTPVAMDIDGDTLTFEIANQPSWTTFNASTGRLTGTPSGVDVGTYPNIIISVTDSVDTVDLAPFNIEVMNEPAVTTNNQPTISGNPVRSLYENEVYNFTPVATDIDGDTLTFKIANQPSWTTFNVNTGRLTGTPSRADIGIYSNIIISVTDNIDTVNLAAFNIEVMNEPVVTTNNQPTISGNPVRSLYENEVYNFTPVATDIDGDILTFKIANQPSWATFNANTGRLTGTPSGVDVGAYSNIIISVTDNIDTVNLAAFNIEVMNEPVLTTNNQPTISGNPVRSIYENEVYNFTPIATDIDGDTLTFKITNQPSWTTFNANTGRLTGTPSSAELGLYSNVIISVTDGIDTVSLAPFNIEVLTQQTIHGSATLSWVPPTTYLDNSPLTNLGGYKIYYGTSPGSYSEVINLPNPGLVTYVVENLTGNTTYYFVVTAYDADGIESGFSSSVSIFIP